MAYIICVLYTSSLGFFHIIALYIHLQVGVTLISTCVLINHKLPLSVNYWKSELTLLTDYNR